MYVCRRLGKERTLLVPASPPASRLVPSSSTLPHKDPLRTVRPLRSSVTLFNDSTFLHHHYAIIHVPLVDRDPISFPLFPHGI